MELPGRSRLNRLMRLVLASGRGRFQSVLAMAGFGFGLIMLLGSLNLAIAIHRATSRSGDYAEYLIANKRVSAIGMLTYIRASFTEAELAELAAQPFVVDLGRFVTSRFRVSAMATSSAGLPTEEGINHERDHGSGDWSMALPFYTDLFFEAIPDRFLDVRPSSWQWTPESQYLPIIMSREFLNLYNFSFALAQGLPQLPESLIGSVGGAVTITGPGGSRTLRARVVGLSDRIPSIIVPESFMLWANRTIAEDEPERPSRIMIKTDRPADPAMLDYFRRRNLQVNSERLRAGRVGRMAVLALTVVGAVGGLLVVLALLLFILLTRLILTESSERISWLLQLGYSPAMLIAHILLGFWFNLSLVAGFTAIVLGGGLPFLHSRLRDAGFDPGSALLPFTLAVGFGIFILTGLANWLSVRKVIYRSDTRAG